MFPENRTTSLATESLPVLDEIRRWFETPLGRHILMTEKGLLDQLLPGMFGYHLAQFSVQDEVLSGSSTIQNRFTVAFEKTGETGLVAVPDNLPLASDSIDVVLLHHLLDFTGAPQDVLREISRVTMPMGHIVIIGFNPLSTWGVWGALAKYRGRAPWNGSFIRPGRMMDWLNLLNFKIDRAQYAIYRPPVPRCSGRVKDYSQGVSRSLNLPVGSIYVIVARKHVGSMRPIRPVWKKQPAFGRLSVVQSIKHDGVNSVKHPDQDDRF